MKATWLQVAQCLGLDGEAHCLVFDSYRAAAKRRGLHFALGFEEFRDLITSECRYCGDAPSNLRAVHDGGIEYAIPYQGIDRVDNVRGYERENVVPCCAECNRSKGAQSEQDFVERARRVAERAA